MRVELKLKESQRLGPTTYELEIDTAEGRLIVARIPLPPNMEPGDVQEYVRQQSRTLHEALPGHSLLVIPTALET